MPVFGVTVDFLVKKKTIGACFSFVEAKHYQKMHPEKGFSSFL